MNRRMLGFVIVSAILAALVALAVPAFAAENATITGDNVRIRSFSFGEILGELARGTRVEVLTETDFLNTIDGYTAPWYEISYGGQTGYVFGRYLKLDGGTTVDIDPTNRYNNRITRFVRDNLALFGTSQLDIIKSLGQPISSTEYESVEAGLTVKNHRLTYDGISFEISGQNGDDDGLAFSLTCTTGSYNFGGLRVGSPVTDVKRILGEPDRVDGDRHTYSTILSAIHSASFRIQNGKVTEITLSSLSYD